jgi:hypothetical protein
MNDTGDLNIAATQSTPSIEASRSTGVVTVRGDSYPENSFQFFAPIIDWIEEYLAASSEPLRFDLYLLYLNTSSVKSVMDIFDLLEEAHGNGREVRVCWYYHQDNARIADLAEEFKEDCTFPFEIVCDNC